MIDGEVVGGAREIVRWRVDGEIERNELLFAVIGERAVELFLVLLRQCIIKIGAPGVVVNLKNGIILASQVGIKIRAFLHPLIFLAATLREDCGNIECYENGQGFLQIQHLDLL